LPSFVGKKMARYYSHIWLLDKPDVSRITPDASRIHPVSLPVRVFSFPLSQTSSEPPADGVVFPMLTSSPDVFGVDQAGERHQPAVAACRP